MQDTKPLQVLLVEDNPDDVEIIRWLFEKSRLAHELHVVGDGQEALDFLFQETPPDIILLDLYLPKKDGHEVLAELKGHPDLRVIPILVLTTSNAEQDFARALRRGAQDYLLKGQLDRNSLIRSVRYVLEEEGRVEGKEALP